MRTLCLPAKQTADKTNEKKNKKKIIEKYKKHINKILSFSGVNGVDIICLFVTVLWQEKKKNQVHLRVLV